MGLLSSDKEWVLCMQEAAHFQKPASLRIMFVSLIVHCNVHNVTEIWEQFKTDLSEDYVYRFKVTPSVAEAKALCAISKLLRESGKSLSSIGLPSVDATLLDLSLIHI